MMTYLACAENTNWAQNRDMNGATNIGTNFRRLFAGEAPIRSLSEADLAFHRATLCLECSD